MQACDRLVASSHLRAERAQPLARLRVERGGAAVESGRDGESSTARTVAAFAALMPRLSVERREDADGELGWQPRSTSSISACRS